MRLEMFLDDLNVWLRLRETNPQLLRTSTPNPTSLLAADLPLQAGLALRIAASKP